MINYRAIGYMVLSALTFTILNTIIKEVNYLPTFELVFFRSIGSVFLGLAVLKGNKIPLWGNNKKLLILRAIVGMTGMTLFFQAFKMMPLASAVSLRYLSPFFAAMFAVWLLKEKVSRFQWLFFLTAFGGVVLLKGFDHRITMLGLAVILSAAVLSGLVYVIIRKIGTSEHPVVVVTYFMGIATIVSGIVCLFYWKTPKPEHWILVLLMGILGFIAQVLMTRALQLAEANLIVPFKYAEVIFTLLVGWFLFGEHQTLMALLGIGIIVISLLGNVYVKRFGNKN